MVYCLIIIIIVWVLNTLKIYFINQIFRTRISRVRKLTLIIRFLSLGGMPPLLGFFPKLIIVEGVSGILILFNLLILIARRVITLFYYTRAGLNILMLDYIKVKSNYNIYIIIPIVLVLMLIFLGGIIRSLLFQRFLQ